MKWWVCRTCNNEVPRLTAEGQCGWCRLSQADQDDMTRVIRAAMRGEPIPPADEGEA